MPAPVANALLMAAGLAAVAGAVEPYNFAANNATTETLAPQELGSMTADGSVLYTVNMCTVVRSINCQLTTSTSTQGSGAAPSTGLKVGTSIQAYSAEGSVETPVSFVPDATTTQTEVGQTTMTRGNSSMPTTRKALTATESVQYWPSTSTYSAMPTSTGASNTVSVMRGVAVGAGAMAVAFLF
ncbi:hypothetical protein L249_0047 [Ophiocordyceps polyrhachis-furcata BCC 54312]|uniref:Uncharacterized protein n=1 Tax=Ophiocordyceps polyrhachis-furcata BCC 54312 TaxID=1330021 RepID=A0A367LD80_9HYPO|nr:hypothetical protein L249_0047 [Ophiocordyceps polyrhachis-furcata BCC 54312]